MANIKITSSNKTVLSSGSVFFNREDGMGITVGGHSTKNHPKIEAEINIKYQKKGLGVFRFKRDKAETVEENGLFKSKCTLLLNFEGGKPNIQENVLCGEYPGGNLYITFHAFDLFGTNQMGLNYTIYEVEKD